ncbi:hypothetical protein [Paenibacillus lautus]|uniref:hypothetical protein n=1 Tax=Paenibacillus lautus TaxID=1401 RepID=UPI003D29FA97
MSNERDHLKDLVVSTYEDVKISHEILQNNDSQYNRRTYIRTAFAAVEASSYLLKQHCINENNGEVYSEAEIALLNDETYFLNNKAEASVRQNFLPVADNFKFAIKMYLKLNPNKELELDTLGWDYFKKAIAIRNKIVHPKLLDDFVISDSELKIVEKAYVWVVSKVMYVLIYKIEYQDALIKEIKQKHKRIVESNSIDAPDIR